MARPPLTEEELASARTVRTDPGAVDQTVPAPTPSSAPSLGRRYEIRRELGRGGEGAVYLAFDRHAEEEVALKVLENVSASSEDLARLRRELAMARRISHPGIVRLHDLVEIDGRFALSMEFIDGTSLEARIESRVPFTADAIMLLAREMAAALAAAHEAGVTHRDLKPANVLLRQGGRPVISDFGISRVHGARAAPSLTSSQSETAVRATHEGALIGTPLYMSPEQLQGKTAAGPVVDVYALGLILFEVATGEVPHADVSLPAIVRRRTTEEAPKLATLRPDLPAQLTAVVDRCLARFAPDRYPDGAAVLAALTSNAARGPESRGSSSLRSRSRLRMAGVLAVGSAAVTLGALTFFFWNRTPPPEQATPPSAEPPPAPDSAEPLPPAFKLSPTGHRRITFADGCEEFPSFLPDNKRIVFDGTVGARSHLYVVDIDTGQQQQLTTSPGWDFAARVSPDGKQIAFIRAGQKQMATHVVAFGSSSEPRAVLGGSVRPAFSPDSRSVWAGDRLHPSLVDLESGKVTEVLELPPGKNVWGVLALPGGEVLAAFVPFLDGGQGGIGLVSSAANGRVWSALLSDATEEVLAVPPGGQVAITAKTGPNSSQLIALPLTGGPPIRLVESGIAPGKGFAFSQDGRRLAWSTCRSFANVVPFAEDSAAVAQAWEDLDSSALPDGKLATISGRDGTMKPWILDPTGASPARSLDLNLVVTGIAASPDGKQLVLTTPRGLVLVDTSEKTAPRPLTGVAGDVEAAFTSDGRHVLFTRRNGMEQRIFRISTEGGEALAVGPRGERVAALPGTQDFLYFEVRDGSSTPMVWDAAKGQSRQFSASLGPGRYERAAVTRDGKKVAIARNGTEVIIIDRTSGRIERTSSMAGDELDRPVFLSTGKLYVTRTRWVGDIWVADLPAN